MPAKLPRLPLEAGRRALGGAAWWSHTGWGVWAAVPWIGVTEADGGLYPSEDMVGLCNYSVCSGVHLVLDIRVVGSRVVPWSFATI